MGVICRRAGKKCLEIGGDAGGDSNPWAEENDSSRVERFAVSTSNNSRPRSLVVSLVADADEGHVARSTAHLVRSKIMFASLSPINL